MSAIQSSTGSTPTLATAPTNSSIGTVSPITASIGPVSGINYSNLITALVASQQQQVTNVQNQIQTAQTQQTDYEALEANLASILSSVQALGQNSAFQAHKVQTSDPNQLSVTASSSATPGSYQFQALQLASSQVSLSGGFANADQQTLGTGTLTIAAGGGLATPTLLAAFNGDHGVQLGSIQIKDAAGHTAKIDLSNAYTASDVINAINDNGVASVVASTEGGHLVLTDTSGGSGTLTVANLNGGHTATDLGINQTSSTGTITGQDVYDATSSTLLSQINDGNGIYSITGAPGLKIDLADGTELEVNLNSATTVGDVINDINNATGNGGKLTASVVNGAIQLTDSTTGGGTLTVSDDDGSSVVRALGLDGAASGNTLSGTSLLAGINSVLLKNLNGGQGITQTGQIQLQDRSGLTATIDLTGAQSLDQVINAINSATTTGGQKLNLAAHVDSTGTGIEVEDTSGSTADNLEIQDVGGGTLATQLGIAVNSATSSVDSGSLNLQYVNEATSLSTYAPGGAAVSPGVFKITDSTGQSATITVSNATKTIGDLIGLINSTTGIGVHAQLNSTGDGFSLIDTAGGTGQLSVTENDGQDTIVDLGLSGAGTTNSDGHSEIDSRLATVINITSTDTLSSLAQKIGASGLVSASVVNDGSPFNPAHLALTAKTAGQAGQFFISESGIDLGFQTTTAAQNALLRVGSGANGIIQTSSTNTFNNALPGLTVQLQSVGLSPDTVTVSQDTSSIATSIQNFVNGYNSFISQAQTFTAFSVTTQTGGPLQGSPTVLSAERRLNQLITQSFNSPGSTVQTLVDLGIGVNSDGSLSLDQTKLQSALVNNPQDVTKFFTTATTGFSAVVKSTLNSITDPSNGIFALAVNTLQNSITNYQNRITSLNSILANQQQQLLKSFANLETFISQMKTQEQAISQISLISSDGSSNNNNSNSSSGSSLV